MLIDMLDRFFLTNQCKSFLGDFLDELKVVFIEEVKGAFLDE